MTTLDIKLSLPEPLGMEEIEAEIAADRAQQQRAARGQVRLVLDTNVVLSGLLWTGSPMRILAAAQAGEAELESELKAVRAELREAGARGP